MPMKNGHGACILAAFSQRHQTKYGKNLNRQKQAMQAAAIMCIKKIILVFTFVLFLAGTVFANTSIDLNADAQFSYAENLFSSQNYGFAASEYHRFIFFFPGDNRQEIAKFQIGMCWFNMGDFQKAVHSFSQISFSNALYIKSQLLTAQCQDRMNDPGSAIVTLRNILSSTDQRELHDEILNTIGWLTFKAGDIENALKSFNTISESGNQIYNIRLITQALEAHNPNSRHPIVSGALSAIIPGAGFVYCERYRDGAISFLLNGAMILASVDAFENDNKALGALIAFVETGFYAGNIYGSVSSAHKYNRHQKQVLYKTLKKKFCPEATLGFFPYKAGEAIGAKLCFHF
jgi:tetratricopeptide (TPR) repeat protein